jgi:hypothetical protein
VKLGERGEKKKLESVGETLPQLPWKKRGDLNFFSIPFIKLHEAL